MNPRTRSVVVVLAAAVVGGVGATRYEALARADQLPRSASPSPDIPATPLAPAEIRRIELCIDPPILTATVKLDGNGQSYKTPCFIADLPVGDHAAYVSCPLCAPSGYVAFKVFGKTSVAKHPTVVLPVRYRAPVEIAVDEGVQKVLVDGQAMVVTADSRKLMLDVVFTPKTSGQTSQKVAIVILRTGRPPQQWTQEVVAGRPTVLTPP